VSMREVGTERAGKQYLKTGQTEVMLACGQNMCIKSFSKHLRSKCYVP
jgi:hypothetical protein